MSMFDSFLLAAMLALIVAFFVTLIRFLYGPGFIDRLISFDLMTANLIGVIGIYAMISDKPLLLDIALVLSLIGFFSVVAFTFYIKNRRKNERSS